MKTTLTTPERDPYLWKQAKARVGFKMHLRTYLIINGLSWLIWASIYLINREPIFPWPLWATLGWGIGLAAHYLSVYRNPDEESLVEAEYKRLLNRQ